MSHATSDAHILVSMTYASRANPDVSVKDFETILHQAQIKSTFLFRQKMLIGLLKNYKVFHKLQVFLFKKDYLQVRI